VSAEMRGKAAQDWMREIEETAAILGGITALINPSLFKVGMTCLDNISRNPDCISKNDNLFDILSYWSSPYMGQSLISNRDTPLHRDNGGGYACMDLLVTLGKYKNGWFNVPGLGYNFYYPSGTVVGICGRVVRHGATAVGERVCWSQYCRCNVLKAFDVEEPDWVSIGQLKTYT
jgi:hypothetical protein